jgi:hypothetical protein
MPKGEN